MTSLLVRDRTALKAKTDVLIVGLRPKGKSVVVVGLPTTLKSVASQLNSSLASVHAKADLQSVTTIPGIAGLAATSIIAVGLGPVTSSQTAGQQHEALRLAAGAAVRSISKASTVAIISPSDDAESVAALAQGALLGAYRFTAFRSEQPTVMIKAITVITAAAKDRDVVTQTKSAVAIAQRVDLVKDLVNTPPSHLSPVVFAKTAATEAKKRGITVQVLDEVQLKKRGFGGIIGVGQGSINPPRLVKLTYTHPQAKNTVAFVGKGVTFDSGGLSLKPPTAMETMKSDMAGAAAVLGAILSLADIKAKVNVTAYLAMVENMPSGTAQRPSDVLTMFGGKTVEVLNTDAEGRLILADALVLAVKDGHQTIVDVATLTGAQMVALGNRYAAAMGNNDATRAAVVAAADTAGELMWPMPLPAELRPSLDSTIADLKNIGERFGGMMTAAVFLQEFVNDKTNWVHLDIAGPSFNEGGPHGYTGKGGTGYALRTLVQFALNSA